MVGMLVDTRAKLLAVQSVAQRVEPKVGHSAAMLAACLAAWSEQPSVESWVARKAAAMVDQMGWKTADWRAD